MRPALTPKLSGDIGATKYQTKCKTASFPTLLPARYAGPGAGAGGLSRISVSDLYGKDLIGRRDMNGQLWEVPER